MWKGLPAVEGFKQREPVVGEAASEATTVRIGYDNTNLYIGAFLADSSPTDVRASELRRDNTLESDDTFSVLLDTYLDRRNAFIFKVNPRGTRYDALVRNESRFFYTDWDEQWTAAAVMLDNGWSVEIAIPFKTLRFTGAREADVGPQLRARHQAQERAGLLGRVGARLRLQHRVGGRPARGRHRHQAGRAAAAQALRAGGRGVHRRRGRARGHGAHQRDRHRRFEIRRHFELSRPTSP